MNVDDVRTDEVSVTQKCGAQRRKDCVNGNVASMCIALDVCPFIGSFLLTWGLSVFCRYDLAGCQVFESVGLPLVRTLLPAPSFCNVTNTYWMDCSVDGEAIVVRSNNCKSLPLFCVHNHGKNLIRAYSQLDRYRKTRYQMAY